MTTVTPVAFYGWTGVSKDWQRYLVGEQRTVINSLTLMTWNVWYERVEEKFRHREILHQIHLLRQEVDVIALQEVTQKFLSELRSDESIQQH